MSPFLVYIAMQMDDIKECLVFVIPRLLSRQ